MIVFTPAPAIAGSNVLPLIPAPEKLPPEGEPLKVIGVALLHIKAGRVKLNGDTSFTKILAVVSVIQPLSVVNV